MTQPSQKIMWLILIAALGLLGSGMLISTDTKPETALRELQTSAAQATSRMLGRAKLETALRELQTAYAAEQATTKKLAQKAEELSNALGQAQVRVTALEEGYLASEQEKGKLEAKATKLETALRELQTAYAAEQQATTKKLTQKAEELLKAWEQAQPRVKALEESQKASEQEKRKLEAKATKLETALQELQTAYAAEQATTKTLTEKAEELSNAQEQARARAKVLEERQTDLVALHHAIGNSYNKRGKNEEALKAFQIALELDPNHAESHFDLARVYLEHLNDREAAAPHLRRYVQLRSDAQNAERVKGWLMKFEKELKAKKAVK